MSPAPLRFLFDYISPYAYLAWARLPALAERNARGVELVPVLFSGLLHALGTRGPAEDGELFFGVDSLGHLEQFLRGEDPFTPAELERWRDLPASASRT